MLYLSYNNIPFDPKYSLSINVDRLPTFRDFLRQPKDEKSKDVYFMSQCTSFVAEVRHKVAKNLCNVICKQSIR